MILGAYISYGTGHHPAAWRMESSRADGAQNIEYYAKLVKHAEESLFDFIFLSDTPSVFADDHLGYGSRVVVFEPLTFLSAMATQTSHIGLIATSSTSYKEPFNLAREYASLDWISGGRAGWNLVTSSKAGAAVNFGCTPHPEHDVRYDRAEEFFDLICRFWDSWEDDAFPRDKETGFFYDPAKRHPVHFEGTHFRIAGGLLNIARPVQGRPVIVQAGSSATGRDFAARHAELVFTASGNIDDAREFYRDVKARAARYGRDPDQLKILPGCSPYCGPTADQGQSKLQDLQGRVAPGLALSMLSDLLGGFDLSLYDLDGPLPTLPPSNGNQSRRAMIERLAAEPGATIRSLYERLVISRGHFMAIGSYQDIADELIEWVATGAADGFNIMPPQMPDFLKDFSEGVIPLLQRTGWFKNAYRAGTLRDKLGLDRPQHSQARVSTA
jgi:FMN-dependent oxidoreductase (nitrilotriacetate monooxygenase family)